MREPESMELSSPNNAFPCVRPSSVDLSALRPRKRRSSKRLETGLRAMGRPRSSHGDRHLHQTINLTAPADKAWKDFNPAPRAPTILKHRHPPIAVPGHLSLKEPNDDASGTCMSPAYAVAPRYTWMGDGEVRARVQLHGSRRSRRCRWWGTTLWGRCLYGCMGRYCM